MHSSLNDDTDSGTSSQELATFSTPIGIELQLVDDDDDNVPSPSPQNTQASEQTIAVMLVQRVPGNIHSDKERHAPAMYNDCFIKHLRRLL